MLKGTIDGILDVANFARNYIGGNLDRSGFGPRMTKWDGNTMSATESEDAKGNAVATTGGFLLGHVTSLGANGERVVAGSINYVDPSDQFGVFGSRVKPQSGALDVIGHGETTGIDVNNITIQGGKIKNLNHRQLAKLITNNPEFVGQDIRLISCSTGKGDFAQNLANKLNTNVFAPNEVIWITEHGRFFVVPMKNKLPVLSSPGKMIKFSSMKK